MNVTPSTGTIGAEITPGDGSVSLTAEDYPAVRRALLEHKVVALSNFAWDFPALLAFGRRFGELVPHILDQYHHPETSEVSVISTNPEGGKGRTTDKPAGAFWHSDLSYDANPSDATLLYAVEIPRRGGDTLFADMTAAYETLPKSTKARIEGLEAVHRYGHNGGGAIVRLDTGQDAAHPDVVHPVVRRHRETGKKALYVNPGFTVRIDGMAEDESRALLDELFEHAVQPTHAYRHQWRMGQLVIMDNRACMHCAIADYSEPRTLWRMIVGGGDR